MPRKPWSIRTRARRHARKVIAIQTPRNWQLGDATGHLEDAWRAGYAHSLPDRVLLSEFRQQIVNLKEQIERLQAGNIGLTNTLNKVGLERQQLLRRLGA